jgi:sodium transport system ATP-binding protein
MQTVIKAEQLQKYFGAYQAVKNVSFEVKAGQIFGLLGANGAGKTTTLRMLAGILQPTQGSTYIANYNMQTDKLLASKYLGFLTGEMNLFERMTPTEILYFFGNLYEVPSATLRQRVEELISTFQITSFKDKLAGTLSTGQKQRVSIARTLVHNPAAIILDEPTTGLDIMSSELILNFIADAARKEGKAVLFSTHHLDEVERLCDYIGILQYGEMLAVDTPQAIKEKTQQGSLHEAFFKLVSA